VEGVMDRVREGDRAAAGPDAGHAEARVELPSIQFVRRPGAVTPRTAPASSKPKRPS